MALIVEDGSGKPNAQTYSSVADVVTYGALYGLTTTHVDEPTIMRAMQYLEGAYFEKWVGIKKTEEQALAWPRSYATRKDGYTVSESIIPVEVKNALCALACRATAGVVLAPDISRSDVAREEEIGPIRVRYESTAPIITIYRDIEFILRPLIMGGLSGKIVRT
jgi:hypothetical protein